MPNIHPWYEPLNGFPIKWETPIAKKEHACTRCGQLINPGEKYVREIWRDERQTHALKFHIDPERCKPLAKRNGR